MLYRVGHCTYRSFIEQLFVGAYAVRVQNGAGWTDMLTLHLTHRGFIDLLLVCAYAVRLQNGAGWMDMMALPVTHPGS
jgi:hypothetical protein